MIKRHFLYLVAAFFIAGGIVGAVAPGVAAAELDRPINIAPGRVDNIPVPPAADPADPNELAGGVTTRILNGVYIIAATIAIISLIWAGYLYITSNGDSSKTATARQAIIYSVVGLVIIGSAFIITGVIQNIANS